MQLPGSAETESHEAGSSLHTQKGQHDGSRRRSALATAAVQRGKAEGSPRAGIKADGGVWWRGIALVRCGHLHDEMKRVVTNTKHSQKGNILQEEVVNIMLQSSRSTDKN
jgi:hypothetical protein